MGVKRLGDEEQKNKEQQQVNGCCFGCLTVFLILIFWFQFGGSGGGGGNTTPPATSSRPSGPAGKVDAAGRIYPGTKLYTATGQFFGTVTQQVVYNSAKEECVEVSLASGGERFLLKRSAIRQGNTWFTDP